MPDFILTLIKINKNNSKFSKKIAGMSDLGIAEKIDERVGGKKDPHRIVSTGMVVVAMLLNGLGFTNRRLYLTPQ